MEHSLRLPDESEASFRDRAARIGKIARTLVDACLANECMQHHIADDDQEGPQILPLKPDDWFYAKFVSYQYRPNSLYNQRFEQRRRLKELLGRRWRPLVERAKRFTKTIFLRNLTAGEAKAIHRILDMEPGEFWRAANARKIIKLPPRIVQREFDFGEPE